MLYMCNYAKITCEIWETVLEHFLVKHDYNCTNVDTWKMFQNYVSYAVFDM